MAIVRSLAIGKSRNSIGQITYQTVKGRTIAREKPAHVHNPRTEKQVAQRTKMKNVVAAWRNYFFMCHDFFTTIKGYGSAYNEFVRRNIHEATQSPLFEDEINAMAVSGYTFATGKYPENALSYQGTSQELTLEILSPQLRFELQENDEFIVLYQDPGIGKLQLKTVVITSQMVNDLKNEESITIQGDFGEGYGVAFYSSARNIASTGVYRI